MDRLLTSLISPERHMGCAPRLPTHLDYPFGSKIASIRVIESWKCNTVARCD